MVDIEELLGLPVIGVVPGMSVCAVFLLKAILALTALRCGLSFVFCVESRDILPCTNVGSPVITLGDDNPAAGAFNDMVDRFLGEEKELRFVTPEPVSFFSRIFG